MKILHVNYYADRGGAAVAAHRICLAEREAGMDAEMLVAFPPSPEAAQPWIHCPWPPDYLRNWQRGGIFFNRVFGDKRNFMPRSFNWFPHGLVRKINQSKTDIVHLHWIGGGMLGISELPQITAPVVWTLHDPWPYCGNEHHHRSGDTRFANGYCGFSLEAVSWQIKKYFWNHWKPAIAGPSRWVAAEARKSILFKNCRITCIPNPVPTQFVPGNKVSARKKFGIPPQSRVILIGSANLHDQNKCGALLQQTLQCVAEQNKCLVLVVGPGTPPILPVASKSTGPLSEMEMIDVYRAADVLLAVSKYDNLPNMPIEAAACGTPTVAARVGGVGDIFENGNNGFAVEPSPEALADTLIQVLNSPENIRFDVSAFRPKTITEQYAAFYREVLLGDANL